MFSPNFLFFSFFNPSFLFPMTKPFDSPPPAGGELNYVQKKAKKKDPARNNLPTDRLADEETFFLAVVCRPKTDKTRSFLKA